MIQRLLPPIFLLAIVFAPVAEAATLAHRYSFDVDATDSAGGVHGLLIGDAVVSNGRLVLDGDGDRMDFESTIGIGANFGSTGVTIESWYTDSGSGTWAKLFTFGSASAGRELAFTHRRGNGETTGVDRDGARLLGFDVPTGEAHHLVIAVSPDGNLNTWVDGDRVLTNIDTNNLSNVTSQNEFLGESAWNDPEHLGSIDEFRIWSGELTAADVEQSRAAGPDSPPGGGPIVTAFNADPAAGAEGGTSALSWTIDTSTMEGVLALEILDPGGGVIHSSAAANGSVNVALGDTGGTARTLVYTLNARDNLNPGNVRSATTKIVVDPGVPVAVPQSLGTTGATPLAITLSGSDPNNHPNPTPGFFVSSPPANGDLTGTPPDLSYTARPGFFGVDRFSFRVNDGKYNSAPAEVSIDVVPPPAPPTAIFLSTTNIDDGVTRGGFIAALSSADVNPGDLHTYSLVAGTGDADNVQFTIVGNQLRAATDFIDQLGGTRSIRLRTTDSGGLSHEQGFLLTVVEVPDNVVINEIHFNPPDNTVRQEFIELYNPGDESADLSGWRLSGAINFAFPVGTSIPPDGYLVIAEDPATLASTLNAAALGPFAGSLDSDGETVRLRDTGDRVIDKVDYKVGFPWPVAADGGGASIELINPRLDNSLGGSWRASPPGPALGEATLLPFAEPGWSWRPGGTEASDPIDAWRERGFAEDETWTGNAPTPIGYGNVNGVTLNTVIAGMRGSYGCVFLRNTFTIAPDEVPGRLRLDYHADDGVVVWINGVEILRERFGANESPTIDDLASGTGTEGALESGAIVNPGAFLVEGTNTIAVQLFNATIDSSDLGFDIEIIRPAANDPQPAPTPGARNAAFAKNAAPNIRKVGHSPEQPTATDPVVISAKVTDPEGVAAVTLEYQVVAPGAYVPAKLPLPVVGNNINLSQPRPDNPAYETNWIGVVMRDDGANGDALAGDDVFTATLPASPHRSLVRYRITVEDAPGLAARAPYPDDASLNFAFFVYNGVPDYNGHSADTLRTLPVYHLITRGGDYAECLAYSRSDQINQGAEARFFYNWNGAIVYHGEVYDNIRYRLRGANGRYQAAGKRSMRFRFNDGRFFQARDQRGGNYPKKWRTLTTGKGFDNRSTLTYALNEAVSLYLFNRIGVPGSETHWIHWRVIDDAAEAPDQWRGDFHGLNFVLETYDVRFLEAHDLEKGNLYKLINQTSDWRRQQRYQGSFAPDDGSDHKTIEGQLDGGDSAAYIAAHVRMDRWNRWHALVEAIRHYDYWPSANKNMVYYFEPDYLPANGSNGRLWILPWDTDASWGPTWNNGHDVVFNALFPASGGGADGNSTPALWPDYFNTVREIRDLLWQPDQIGPLIDEFAAFIAPFEDADADRWKGAPSDAGNYNGLGGRGAVSLAALVRDLKNFAFVGGSWPGGGVGAGGRAAHLDSLQASRGEGDRLPITPTITYTGAPGFPTDGLSFECSNFSDPQGDGTFASMEWRIAEITDPTAPNHDPAEQLKLEIESAWESGELSVFDNFITFPTVAVRSGHTYRARVRHMDNSGRWSHWSPPLEFTTTLPDISDYLDGIVLTEVMYHPADPSPAEIAAGFDDDDFFEYIELQNVGGSTLDLTDLRFTKGVDFDFIGAAVTSLAAGEFAVVVKNQAAFKMRYGAGLPVAGEWRAGDKLDNGGERLKLSFGAGAPIRDFAYDDAAPWPTAPDGSGPSLTLRNPGSTPDHALAANWVPSSSASGTPGTADDAGSSYAAWRDETFGPGGPPGSAELGDPDSDQAPNLIEYALGTDPLNAASAPKTVPRVVNSGGQNLLTLTYTRRTDRPDVRFHVEVSTDLENWRSGNGITAPIGAAIDNGDESETVSDASLTPIANGPRQFLRVVVETQ